MSLRLLTLADKYHIETLKDKLIAHFSADWPRTLKEWDVLDIAREVHWHERTQPIDCTDWPEDLLPEPISALIFAQKARIPEILPALYLDIHRAARGVDWDIAKDNPSKHSIRKGARWNMATTQHLLTLLAVQGAIDSVVGLYTCDMLTDNELDEDCRTLRTCQPLRIEKLQDVTSDICISRDALAVLRSLTQWGREYPSLCEPCREWIRLKVPLARERIWGKVGEVFHNHSSE